MNSNIRKLKSKKQVVFVVALLFIPLTVFTYNQLVDKKESGSQVNIDGFEASLSVQELAYVSDLVLIGTPTEESIKPFTSVQIPEGDKQKIENDPIYKTGNYYDVTVKVERYLKGSGPDLISIRRLAAGSNFGISSEAPVPEIGTKQIMFISNEGGVWTGGYIINGSQSLGRIVDGTVNFLSGQTLTLQDVEKLVASPKKPEFYNN